MQCYQVRSKTLILDWKQFYTVERGEQMRKEARVRRLLSDLLPMQRASPPCPAKDRKVSLN